MFDLDAFVGFDEVAEDVDVVRGGQEGLVSATVFIVDVFADDAPVGNVKDVRVVEGVGVNEAIEDESDGVSVLLM